MYKPPKTIIKQYGLYFAPCWDNIFNLKATPIGQKQRVEDKAGPNIAFTSSDNMADCVDVPIKVDAKYDILEQVVKKIETENPGKYNVTATGRLDVKNLSDVDNLRIRVNDELGTLIIQLPTLQNSIVARTFPAFRMLNTNVMEYTQPDKCQLLLSPRIFRIFGMAPPSEWIATTKLTGVNKPGLDKFLQTMWIYTDMIQAQYVGNVQTPLLRVIPVATKKDGSRTVGVVYDYPLFCKMKSGRLDTLDFLITSSEGTHPVDFVDDEVILGLIFKRCDV